MDDDQIVPSKDALMLIETDMDVEDFMDAAFAGDSHSGIFMETTLCSKVEKLIRILNW